MINRATQVLPLITDADKAEVEARTAHMALELRATASEGFNRTDVKANGEWLFTVYFEGFEAVYEFNTDAAEQSFYDTAPAEA